MAVYCQDSIPVRVVWPAREQPPREVSPLKLARSSLMVLFGSIQLSYEDGFIRDPRFHFLQIIHLNAAKPPMFYEDIAGVKIRGAVPCCVVRPI
jgi:hypothetical protein